MARVTDLENLKKVLFGNQLQANVTNDAVVDIVYRYLTHNATVIVNLDTEDTAAVTLCDELNTLMQSAAQPTGEDELFVKLVAGITSYNNLVSGEPAICEVSQPNLESPKRLFRIHLVGTDDVEEQDRDYSARNVSVTDVTQGVDMSSLEAKAEEIYKKIEPLIPETVKENVKDKYAQALIAAQAYYSM